MRMSTFSKSAFDGTFFIIDVVKSSTSVYIVLLLIIIACVGRSNRFTRKVHIQKQWCACVRAFAWALEKRPLVVTSVVEEN